MNDPTADSTGDPVANPAANPTADSTDLRSGHEGSLVDAGRLRVHPITPLLAAARVFVAFAAIVAFNVAQQARGVGDLIEFLTGAGPGVFLGLSAGVAVAFGVFALLSWVSWRYRFFEITDDEVRIGSGWLIRSRRSARFDRVQAVDINQPLLARIAGLGEVKVETAGGNDSDLTIKYLSMDDCRAVRSAVLVAKRDAIADSPTPAPVDHGARPTDVPPSIPDPETLGQTPLHGPIPPPRLLWSAALGPGLLIFVAIPVVIAVSAFIVSTTAIGEYLDAGDTIFAAIGAIVGTSVFGIAAFIIGAVGSVWQRWNRFHGFTLTADDAAQRLNIRAGLTSTRRQTIPVGRIHAVKVTEPAWWRPAHWATVHINVAGYAGEGSEVSTILLPVAPVGEADAVVDDIIGRISGRPRSAGEATWSSPERSKWVSPIDWRRQTVTITPRALVVTSGRLRRRRAMIPWARIQGRTLVQGPVSRAMNLVDVRIDLIAGPITVTARQLDPADATALVRVLDERRAA